MTTVETVIDEIQDEATREVPVTVEHTPKRYRAEPKQYENKDWLYEKYWGKLLSQQEIADEADTHRTVIRENMNEHGIPTRADGYTRDNCMSAFSGFYSDIAARGDGNSHEQFDPDYDRSNGHTWNQSHWIGIGD